MTFSAVIVCVWVVVLLMLEFILSIYERNSISFVDVNMFDGETGMSW